MSDQQLPDLLGQLESGDETEKRYALQDIAELRLPESVEAILKYLTYPSTAIREAVIEALISIAGPQTVIKAIQLLHSEDSIERNSACEILEKIGSDALPLLLDEGILSPVDDVKKFSLDIISNMQFLAQGEHPLKEKIISEMIRCLQSANENIIIAAVEALGKIGDKRIIDTLLANLNRSLMVQYSIIHSIYQLAPQEFKEHMKKIDLAKHDLALKQIIDSYLMKNAKG